MLTTTTNHTANVHRLFFQYLNGVGGAAVAGIHKTQVTILSSGEEKKPNGAAMVIHILYGSTCQGRIRAQPGSHNEFRPELYSDALSQKNNNNNL